ncbi:hypothetical protein ACFXGR_22410 [Streptomyces mirabilis]|uniref:hypothetical protein n=1 Tax=Streptomyces mirabilis TaxID=68239 RepID=UPI00367E08E7
MTENQQQTREQTPDEQFRTLFDRTAKLNDAVSALLNPNWGANMGILPEDHPLYPKTLESLPSSIAKKPRLLDCGWCYEENGEEVHPHPECPIGYSADDQREQSAPVDWQAIVRDRERELKEVGKARHHAETEVRYLAATLRETLDAFEAYWARASYDGPAEYAVQPEQLRAWRAALDGKETDHA